MQVRFPTKAQIPATVRQQGFVGRAAMINGQRQPTLRVRPLQKNRILTQQFGYIAGTATHVNVGLEHCTQITLFDLAGKVGSSSHFQVFNTFYAKSRESEISSPQDLRQDIADMLRTMVILGSNKKDVRAFCIFGVNHVQPADVEQVVSAIKAVGLPLVRGVACKNADDLYATHLDKGFATISPSTTLRTRRLFAAQPNKPDLSSNILQLFEEGTAYHRELCGDHGAIEFNTYLLPRLAALNFNRPKTAGRRIRQAVEIGAECLPETIGQFFRMHELPQN